MIGNAPLLANTKLATSCGSKGPTSAPIGRPRNSRTVGMDPSRSPRRSVRPAQTIRPTVPDLTNNEGDWIVEEVVDCREEKKKKELLKTAPAAVSAYHRRFPLNPRPPFITLPPVIRASLFSKPFAYTERILRPPGVPRELYNWRTGVFVEMDNEKSRGRDSWEGVMSGIKGAWPLVSIRTLIRFTLRFSYYCLTFSVLVFLQFELVVPPATASFCISSYHYLLHCPIHIIFTLRPSLASASTRPRLFSVAVADSVVAPIHANGLRRHNGISLFPETSSSLCSIRCLQFALLQAK
ncbi:hypothetical protein BXZ70DRAFT_303760 [Cristinia sonorae]|uniref:Uncharacterized protein n=1 Tax=Cristinia sonorae TaxID=1940300 RepID=A0A8K0XNF8_9AGAR|nr:hypothetical protein BXZ70DRAFT_303760 [Cristinia sonorae]